MSNASDLSDSIAKLNALRERIRKAEEAAVQEEQLRKQKEDSSMQLIFDNQSLKQEVTKEQQALQEVQEEASKLDAKRKELQQKLQNIQSQMS